MFAAGPAGQQTGRRRFGLVALVALGTLAACSSVPDWANPVSWYDDMFGDTIDPADPNPQSRASTEGRQRLEDAQTAPNPRVGSVPDRPKATSREERTAVMNSLAADRDAARYTDEELRGRPASTANLGAPPPTQPQPASPQPASPPPVAAAPAPPVAVPASPAPPPAVAPSPGPATATAPVASQAAAAPVAVAPLTAAPQPMAPTAPPPVAYATPPAVPGMVAARPVATMPPPPSYAPVAPIRDTAVLQSTYQSALAQSAATVTTAPANAAFATARPAPLQQPATAIPANVLQTYQDSAPPGSYVAPAPPAAPIPVAAITPHARAGSRLAGTVDFPSGSATLDRRDREAISTALADNNSRGGGAIRVVGYAPASAGQKGAFRLSQDRAAAVANELVKAGANRQYVYVEGRSAPSGGNANRVEVYLEN